LGERGDECSDWQWCCGEGTRGQETGTITAPNIDRHGTGNSPFHMAGKKVKLSL
jgi:hypothetical protein